MLLQELIQSVVLKYPDDPSAPSVVLSWLEDRQRWYASAVRYTEKFGRGKVVMCSATGESLEEALMLLASELYRIRGLQESSVLFEFTVREEHEGPAGTATDEFGGWVGPRPVSGDVIQLKWSDGSDAYNVLVLRVDEERRVLRVKGVENAGESSVLVVRKEDRGS